MDKRLNRRTDSSNKRMSATLMILEQPMLLYLLNNSRIIHYKPDCTLKFIILS